MGFVNFAVIRYCHLLEKYAATAKVLAALDKINPSEEIKQYVLSLSQELMPFAVGFLVKNPTADNAAVHAHLQEITNKKKKVEQTREAILKKLPESLDVSDSKYKEWAVRQIKKYPSKEDLIINSIEDIADFADDYDLAIESYEVDQILKEMNNEHDRTESESDSMQTFFARIKQQERKMLDTTQTTYFLLVWTQNKFLEYRKEWEKKIIKYMRDTGQTFPQLLAEGSRLFQAQQAGELLGVDLEASPLHHAEHAKLLNNYPFIADWAAGAFGHVNYNPLKNMSLEEVLLRTRQYHEELAAKGEGKEYDPINPGLIVYGPNNWKDPRYNGHFIIEVKSANDLSVEGFKMDHCVGGYCDAVESGNSKVFSLRNSSNEPLVTIETDPQEMVLRQVYGPENSEPFQAYQNMVDEWFNSGEKQNIDLHKLRENDRAALAHESKNPALLSKLIDFGYADIILEREDLPLSVMEWVAQHGDDYSRFLVVKNPKVTPEILRQLSTFTAISRESGEDRGERIRIQVARHPKTPIDALINMLNDKQKLDNGKSINGEAAFSAAANPNLPPDILDQIADKTGGLWTSVAKNPNATEETLTKIYQKHGDNSLRYLAQNTKTPSDILDNIYRYAISPISADEDFEAGLDKRFDVAKRLADNTGLSAQMLQGLLENTVLEKGKNYLREELRAKLNLRAVLAANPNLTPEMVMDIAKSSNSHIDEILIANPACTMEALRYIAQDMNISSSASSLAQEALRSKEFRAAVRQRHPEPDE